LFENLCNTATTVQRFTSQNASETACQPGSLWGAHRAIDRLERFRKSGWKEGVEGIARYDRKGVEVRRKERAGKG